MYGAKIMASALDAALDVARRAPSQNGDSQAKLSLTNLIQKPNTFLGIVQNLL